MSLRAVAALVLVVAATPAALAVPSHAAHAAAAECTIAGTPGPDVLVGTPGDDVLCGFGGDDRIKGGRGDDVLRGGPGEDVLRGGRGDDLLKGRDTELGSDQLACGSGTDRALADAADVVRASCESGTPNQLPSAVADAVSTDEDSAKLVAVLVNDTDADGDALLVTSVDTAGTQGQVFITGGGSGVSYDPYGLFEALGAGANGSDSFSYTVSDGRGGVDTARVTVTVTGVNEPPVAVDDEATLLEDANATAIDVLANDTDVDGGPKTINSVSQPTHGTVVITNSGADLTYAPGANDCTPVGFTDDFTYTLNGGSTATVKMTVTCVDDPGVAVDDTATVLEDSPMDEIHLIANDSDPDGPKIANVTQPANGGVVVWHTSESVYYTPHADYCNDGVATDDFTYTLRGGPHETVTATVRVTVTCVDD